MSSTLFALVILQGTSLTFSPGYTTAAECMQQYKGPYISCFAYDPEGTSWTAFFKLPNGGFRTVGRISSEDECRRYIGALKDDIPAACRQLAIPNSCNVACIAPVPPPTTVPPDPASMTPERAKPPVNDIQVNGGRYVRLATLFWAPLPPEPTFASFVPQPIALAAPPKADNEPPKQKQRTAVHRRPQQFDPLQALVSLFTPRGD